VPRTKKATCDYVNPQTEIHCHREPRFTMRLLVHGEITPRTVTLCATCDKNMGRKHLMELGWPHEDAIKWEKDPSHVPLGRLETSHIPLGMLGTHTNGPQGSIRSTRPEQYTSSRRGHILTKVNPYY